MVRKRALWQYLHPLPAPFPAILLSVTTLDHVVCVLDDLPVCFFSYTSYAFLGLGHIVLLDSRVPRLREDVNDKRRGMVIFGSLPYAGTIG